MITDLIDKIPEILQYLIYGYVFLTAYHWISFTDDKNFKNIIVKSVAVSYILKCVYQLIYEYMNFDIRNSTVLVVSAVLLSGILGLVTGKIVTCSWFNTMLNKFHIGRTTNENIWDDVIEDFTWLTVYMKDGTSYMGQYRFGESFKSEPIIALETYVKYNKKGEIVLDNRKYPNYMILINTKDFEQIEVHHMKDISGFNNKKTSKVTLSAK